MEALLDISRKPKSNSKSIDQSVIDLAIQVRKDNYNAGAKLTTLLLKRDHGIEIHASTLGYIFRRKNISQQYRNTSKKQPYKALCPSGAIREGSDGYCEPWDSR